MHIFRIEPKLPSVEPRRAARTLLGPARLLGEPGPLRQRSPDSRRRARPPSVRRLRPTRTSGPGLNTSVGTRTGTNNRTGAGSRQNPTVQAQRSTTNLPRGIPYQPPGKKPTPPSTADVRRHYPNGLPPTRPIVKTPVPINKPNPNGTPTVRRPGPNTGGPEHLGHTSQPLTGGNPGTHNPGGPNPNTGGPEHLGHTSQPLTGSNPGTNNPGIGISNRRSFSAMPPSRPCLSCRPWDRRRRVRFRNRACEHAL